MTGSTSSSTVTVRPAGLTFEVPEGSSLLEAAGEQGIRWPTTCFGQGTCRVCVVQVLDGEEHVNEISALEAEGLETLVARAGGPMRLACQLRPTGDLTVFKRGVKRDAGT